VPKMHANMGRRHMHRTLCQAPQIARAATRKTALLQKYMAHMLANIHFNRSMHCNQSSVEPNEAKAGRIDPSQGGARYHACVCLLAWLGECTPKLTKMVPFESTSTIGRVVVLDGGICACVGNNCIDVRLGLALLRDV